MIDVANELVFVAIAAYREPELRLTIDSCVDNAAHPERLRFGVCLQWDRQGPPETQPDCLDGHPAVIRVDSHPWTASKGGCWARHRTQGLYRGEGYTLQIDSHVRMEPNWDARLIEMMHRFDVDKPLITGHQPLYDLTEDGEVFHGRDGRVPVTVARKFAPAGWVEHPGIDLPSEAGSARPTRMLAGAFVFTLGRWNIEVRQDPEHLYTGEEFALTLRSFTCGYDLFNPDEIMVWHRHHPQKNLKFITDAERDEVNRRDQRAFRRLRVLLDGDPDRILLPYSTGTSRSVVEYYDWSGIDGRTKTLSDAAMEGRTPERFAPSW